MCIEELSRIHEGFGESVLGYALKQWIWHDSIPEFSACRIMGPFNRPPSIDNQQQQDKLDALANIEPTSLPIPDTDSDHDIDTPLPNGPLQHMTAHDVAAPATNPHVAIHIVLNLFSGRRRDQDIHYFLERHITLQTQIMTISVDLVNDVAHGDLLNPENVAFWRHAINQDYVSAVLGGPPCETWSAARDVPIRT